MCIWGLRGNFIVRGNWKSRSVSVVMGIVDRPMGKIVSGVCGWIWLGWDFPKDIWFMLEDIHAGLITISTSHVQWCTQCKQRLVECMVTVSGVPIFRLQLKGMNLWCEWIHSLILSLFSFAMLFDCSESSILCEL